LIDISWVYGNIYNMKYCKQTGYGYYPFNILFMMINILHAEHADPDTIPWDYITILLEEVDDLPTA